MDEKKSFLRNVIGEYMTTLGNADPSVVIVNADLMGTCRNRGFAETFPERAFNVGIAEQNMVSFAAGLAREGFKPYVFSMAPFLTMRACEQCRTDVAYGNQSVRLMGVYAGVSGGISGATHWGVEDCGIMTSIPGMTVYEVSDANLARRLLDFSLEESKPMYVRSSVEPTQNIYSEFVKVKRGGSITVMDGGDGAFLCAGVVVQYAMEAASRIAMETGKRIRVVDLYSIKPLDVDAVIDAAKTGHVIAAQDHNVMGGLGSMVATAMALHGIAARFRILGITDEYAVMAHAPYLYKKYKIDAEGLYDSMKELLREE